MPTDLVSRARLLGGFLATGTLAACGGHTGTVVPPNCTPPAPPNPADPFGINEILADPIFNGLDKQGIATIFNEAPHVETIHQGYFAQTGQQAQTNFVIRAIPAQGIIIQTPGTYTFGNDISWTPNNVTSSAITIKCSNVTLDLAGHTLTAAVSDKSQQTAGIFVSGPAADVTITNGTVAGVTDCGILAKYVCGLNISRFAATGLGMQNLNIRFLTPSGILVSAADGVTIANCDISQFNVTTDSLAGIQLTQVIHGSVSGCNVTGLTNNDGAVQGFSYVGCTNVATSGCNAKTLQSHFNGNILTSGHTVLGFCPIFCQNLSFVNCSAVGLTGCCDDCHGFSVFLDANITVSGFQASQIVDGVAPSNTGAKATGLEVYGVNVTISDCSVSNIHAINPQDKQAAGFSAWGAGIKFERCSATNVSVQDDIGGSRGVGFGWAPDPRIYFCYVPAYAVTYTDCTSNTCDVGFDTWYHVNSSWIRPVSTNCATGILVQPGAQRTLSADACSECSPPISVTITNIASGNTYPQ